MSESASASASLEKPNDMELLEDFLRLKHKLGATQEELVERMQASVMWFAQERIDGKLSGVEKLVAKKVNEILGTAIAEHVADVLSH